MKLMDMAGEAVLKYRESVSALAAGNMEAADFKPVGAAMGVYRQRNGNVYMVRLRIPCGVVSPGQLKSIRRLADKYGHGRLHFTTRQDIQLHDVELENTVKIMEELLPEGIITLGAGGNTVRNVACSPLSGVDPAEAFDVTAYAKAAADFVLAEPGALSLPRKYKIAFSNSDEDTANSTISDLGFIAKIKAGVKGFAVYGGGGLGGNPAVAVKLEDFVPAEDVLYHVQAMKGIFEQEGDRTNRSRARIRYILYRLGEEEFVRRYREEVGRLKKEYSLSVNISESGEADEWDAVPVKAGQLFEQKQKGRYSLYIHPDGGNMSTAQLDRVIGFIEALGYGVTIRLTNTQGFFVRDLDENDGDRLLDIVSDFAAGNEIDSSVVCTGAAICTLGICLSQGLLKAIKERFAGESADIRSALPRLFISGCPNSCGQHKKGLIGLSGRMKNTADGAVPMYSIHFGGWLGAQGASLAEQCGDIPAKKVPELLYELAALKCRYPELSFRAFLKEKRDEIDKLTALYVEIAPRELEPQLYSDFTC